MTDETRSLATFASNLTAAGIPDNIRGIAIDLLVDQIGVQIGCTHLPWAQNVRDTYRQTGGTPEATVVGYGDRLPVLAAAFINSTFGHSFEFDDANPLVHGHLGGELIPPLLALSERDHRSGVDFLTAFIAGYEVRGRIGWAVSPDMLQHGGPQYSTTCGPFGVAAAVGKLLKFGPEGIRNAMAIAGSFSGGLMQYDHGGGSVKRIFTAIAGSSGLQSAFMAQAGITGPDEILEGKRGLLKIYPKHYRPERLTSDLGRMWTMEHVLFKPYCCCAIIHPAIDALKKIMNDQKIAPDAIESIEVGYPQGSHNHAGITSPKDLLGMQFSTSYSLALTVLKQRNTPKEYTLEALADPAVKAVAGKVKLTNDAVLDKLFEGHMPARVTVQTVSGHKHEELVIDAKGSPALRLSHDEVDEKFRSMAVDVLGRERSESVIDSLRNIETIKDVAAILPMLVR
jgi:2-methylcitrate dehydratase PrpD